MQWWRIVAAGILGFAVLVGAFREVGLVVWTVLMLFALLLERRDARCNPTVSEQEAMGTGTVVVRSYSRERALQQDALEMRRLGYVIADRRVSEKGLRYVTYQLKRSRSTITSSGLRP